MDRLSDRTARIRLYEDDRALANEIVLAFADHDMAVAVIATEDELLAAMRAPDRTVFILDRMIDGIDSLSIVEDLRKEGNRAPVMVISSLASVDDRIRGLRSGGDDYLVKPFAMAELVARVEVLMRRIEEGRETRLVVGPLVMDLIDRTVRRDTRSIALLPREFSLLEYLMRNPRQIITRTMILETVWHFRAPLKTNVVDVHIGHLRRKVDANDEVPLIRNVRGAGFMLAQDAA